MKKFLFTIILMIFPILVLAKENYQVTDYYVASEVEIAGAIKVKELIVLEGDFSGYERDIVIKNPNLKNYEAGNINFSKSSIYNAQSIEGLKVSAFKVNDRVTFQTMNDVEEFLPEADTNTLGKDNEYTTSNNKTGKNVHVYLKNSANKMAFYYEYTVTNAVVLHKDVAELYYPYISKSFKDDIENVQIQVLLPDTDMTKSFNIWAHGPYKGELKKILNDQKNIIGLLATTNNLKAGIGYDIRMTFDKTLIPISNFLKKSNQNALAEIKKVEKQRWATTLKTRNQLKTFNYVVIIFDFIYLIGLIALAIYTYVINKKFNSDFKDKYNQEIINEYNVVMIDYLYHHKISFKTLISSILNLISKKNIAYDKLKDREYKLTLKNKNNLSDDEAYLTSFLFETIGNEGILTTKDLKNYFTKNNSVFASKLAKWQEKVQIEAAKEKFFANHNSNFMINMIYILLGLIIAIINIFMTIPIIIYCWVILGTLGYLIYNLSINKRSKKGNTHYQKWQGFKRFLKDFDKFELKELPKVALWEKYLVYASILGIYEPTLLKMRFKLKDITRSKDKNVNFILEDGYQDLYHTLIASINIKN